ncbi:MAG: AraC family transcriptional regulator [Oscillospiraceae bacterium]
MYNANFQLKLSMDNSWHMDRPHFHEDAEVIFCLSDGGNFFIDNKLYPLKRGGLFLINEAVLHRSVADNPYERYILHVSCESLAGISTSETNFKNFLSEPSMNKYLTEEETRALTGFFYQCENFKDADFGSDIKKVMCFTALLIEIFSNFRRGEREITIPCSADFERISPILNYIAGHLAEPLTLNIISDNFFINKYHLCHIFKEATGFSVVEYIIHQRVIKARELLRTGMRVQEVSEAVGFQNNQHFIRTFGNLTGTSPKKYANKYLQGYKE